MIGQLVLNGLVSGMLIALPALAVTLTFGILKFPNFSVGGMLTLGAYAGWVFNVRLGVDVMGAALFAAGFTALVGILCDLLVFARMRDRDSITLMVASLGLSLVLENVCRFSFGNGSRSLDVEVMRPMRLHGLRITHEQIVTAAVVGVCVVALQFVLRVTPR